MVKAPYHHGPACLAAEDTWALKTRLNQPLPAEATIAARRADASQRPTSTKAVLEVQNHASCEASPMCPDKTAMSRRITSRTPASAVASSHAADEPACFGSGIGEFELSHKGLWGTIESDLGPSFNRVLIRSKCSLILSLLSSCCRKDLGACGWGRLARRKYIGTHT